MNVNMRARARYWFSELKSVCKQSTMNNFWCALLFFPHPLYWPSLQFVAGWRIIQYRKNETEKKFHIRNWISPGTQINLFAFREMKRQNTAAFALFSRVRKFIFSPHLTFRVNAFIQIVCSHQLPIGEKKNVWKKREPRKPNAVSILSFFIPLFRWLSSARARSSDSNVWRSETSESAHMCITIKITFWNIICRFSEFLYAERSALAWSKTLSNLNAAFSDFFFSLRLLVFAHSFSYMFFFHHRYRKDLLLFFIFFFVVLGFNCAHLT